MQGEKADLCWPEAESGEGTDRRGIWDTFWERGYDLYLACNDGYKTIYSPNSTLKMSGFYCTVDCVSVKLEKK